MRPLTALRLRRLVIRQFSSSTSYLIPSPCLLHQKQPFLSSHVVPTNFPKFLSLPSILPLSRSFSSQQSPQEDRDHIAQSLSTELIRDPDTDPLLITRRLELSFSHISPSPALILSTLNLSHDAGRTVLGFHQWLTVNPKFTHTDETLSFFVDYFGRRKDFKATHEILEGGRGIAGPKCLESSIDRLARAGRATQAVGFFERMERDYGFVRDRESLRLVVKKLCENGYSSYAEKMVKALANECFPDENMCDLLIKGWCIDGKLEEAKRLAEEMYRGGFEIGAMAYNAILDCVCQLCRKKDPFRLHSEAEKVLVEMDVHGVPRNVDTFNVLISNLCKIRMNEDAMKLFSRMGEWGCYPDATTYLVLTRSLYQAARVGEGDEMIDRMKSSGFGDALDKKAYYGFLKILCGIERIDHAMNVFAKMKEDRVKPGIKTYDLLMGKLCAHGRVDKANALFNEAVNSGLQMTPKTYKADPRFAQKPKTVKKEKKRETFPEKMARKRRRLKQIRLSFVKKPKKMMRRAF